MASEYSYSTQKCPPLEPIPRQKRPGHILALLFIYAQFYFYLKQALKFRNQRLFSTAKEQPIPCFILVKRYKDC
jgi:hypothetical protein